MATQPGKFLKVLRNFFF